MIESGGLRFDAAWLQCQASTSFKRDEAFVRINAQEVPEPTLGFLVDRDFVRVTGDLATTAVDGEVKVILLERRNGLALVEVPGEPISYGPKVIVDSGELTAR
jgi:hypothetical protein